jgi:hypothetical protein
MQDEHRPLVDREPAKRPLQLVAVGEGRASLRGRRPVGRQDPDLRCPIPSPLRFVVAGVNEDSVDPGLEAVRLPQVRESAPGDDEGVLQRVLSPTAITQDPERDGEEDVTDLVYQDGECLPIAPTGLLDEVSIHPSTSGRRSRLAADYPL